MSGRFSDSAWVSLLEALGLRRWHEHDGLFTRVMVYSLGFLSVFEREIPRES